MDPLKRTGTADTSGLTPEVLAQAMASVEMVPERVTVLTATAAPSRQSNPLFVVDADAIDGVHTPETHPERAAYGRGQGARVFAPLAAA